MRKKTKQTVGATIQEYRESKGLSRDELAEKTGLSSVSIWKIETGVNAPTTTSIYKIAEALGIPAALLLP